MIALLGRILKALAARSAEEEYEDEYEDDGLVTVTDAHGADITIPRELLGHHIEAELANARGERETGPVWVVYPDGMRNLIAMAREADDAEMALFTIVANTVFYDDDED